MIDLRSDTLTIPSRAMRKYACAALVGDAGRTDETGRSCDPSVNRLEDLACELTGKEAALFIPSGTMGNNVALLTHAKPGEKIFLDALQHSYRIEKAAYSPAFGQLCPIFYNLTEQGIPDIDSVTAVINSGGPLLCVENTHNGAGGVFLPREILSQLRLLADNAKVAIHMDGARLFNASIASGISVKEICGYVDSVMFCLSKGLGAPMGSMLCGDHEFIAKAAEVRKMLGGNLRQAGMMAAAGEYALHNNVPQLYEDHRRTKQMYEALKGTPHIKLPSCVQSNILLIDITDTGMNAKDVIIRLKERGLWLSESDAFHVRMVLYSDINDDDLQKAIIIFKEFIKTL